MHENTFIIILSNHEKIEIDIEKIPALIGSTPEDFFCIELSEDQQTIRWSKLGVMFNVNNVQAYLDTVEIKAYIKQHYFNDGFLVIELTNKDNFMIPVDEVIKVLIASKDKPCDFVNPEYVMKNIKLSENKLYFFWDQFDLKLDIKQIKDISSEARESAIKKMKQKSSTCLN